MRNGPIIENRPGQILNFFVSSASGICEVAFLVMDFFNSLLK